MKLHVLEGDGKRAEDVAGEMCERIKEVIYEYSGRVTTAMAIGVLHIAAREIMDEQQAID